MSTHTAVAQKNAGESPRRKMAEDIQERMRALIAQHGSVLAALTALWQHLEAQRNDEQTDPLENHVPHIDVPIEFNQGTSESARECHNRLQRERHAKQREQPSFRCDALQLFGDKDASALGRWDCGEMDTICGFCNAKIATLCSSTTTSYIIGKWLVLFCPRIGPPCILASSM
jgi:hypothetical protein